MNKLAIPATKDELRLFLRLMMNQKKKKKSHLDFPLARPDSYFNQSSRKLHVKTHFALIFTH